jgi:hypothetical protein
MVIERNITVNLTPKEVEEIIKNHLSKVENIHIDSVSFQTNTKYYGYNDEHGTVEFSGAECNGKIENDSN